VPEHACPQPSTIRAELIGHDTCTAVGLTVTAAAPVLAMCRRLIAASHDPAMPLEAWRGAVLTLRVRSIGEGARLAVKTGPDGTPRFVLAYARGSPVAGEASQGIEQPDKIDPAPRTPGIGRA
jgi:hypothetical protein